jgi:glyoxylase-like metal-dependent hydrolase (beta-lactamase superfamily II)
VKCLHTSQIGKNLYQVDLETGGLKNLICSYIIKGKKTLLVESGPTNSVPKLLSGLQELKVNLEDVEFVAVTHVHLDHGGGVGSLLKFLPNAKVIVHPRGMPHLIDPERLWPSSQMVLGFVSEIFGKPEPVAKERIIPITESSFDLDNGGKLMVVETLGHASHDLSFHESFNGGVFPGDAAGTYFPEHDVVTPSTPFPLHLGAALASLDKLISLNPTVLYYSHFGKVNNAIKRLEDYKLQLKLWAKISEDGASKNQSLEEIRDRILADDPIMHRLAGILKSNKIYAMTVLQNSVEGFIDYAKKTQAKVSS